jgi:cytochrome b561
MSHGILAMADTNIFTQNFNYQKRVTIHWVLQATALVVITIAQSAIYINKENNGYPHYQTTHSIFGLVTYLLTLLATFNGTLTKYSFKLRKMIPPAKIKIIHGFAGIAVYVMAMATIFLGINQSWKGVGDTNVKYGIFMALILTSYFVLGKSFKLTVSRLKDFLKNSKK